MFNIGPMEFLVLAIVGLIVVGPDRVPGLAREAARMLRTLRELATGAQTQFREELGPEFADVDFKSLNPRTALARMLLGDDEPPAGPEPAAGAPPVTLAKPQTPVWVEPQRPGDVVPFDVEST